MISSRKRLLHWLIEVLVVANRTVYPLTIRKLSDRCLSPMKSATFGSVGALPPFGVNTPDKTTMELHMKVETMSISLASFNALRQNDAYKRQRSI